MSIDRNAGVDYAKKFWIGACDDDKIAISSSYPPVSLAAKRKAMGAQAADGWEVFFVAGGAGENAIFRRTVNGKTEDKPDPVYTWDDWMIAHTMSAAACSRKESP